MEQPKPVEAAAPGAPGGRPERPLGRGLEDVARVFLSHEGEERRPVRPLPREQSVPAALLLRPATQVTRDQVAAALREFGAALEEGLRVIDSGIPCGASGEMDLLAVDRSSQLAIVDFDVAPGDELLIRGLAHLDWAAGNTSNLRRMFRGQAINFSLPPRLFLLAPEFSARLRCAARQLPALQLTWVQYHCVETPGRLGILFEPCAAE
jgi:hypothetical protein